MDFNEIVSSQSGNFLLVGCDSSKEQDAMSEFWHVLIKYCRITPVEVFQLPIRGLFLVVITEEPITTLKKVDETIKTKVFQFKYCRRATAIEQIVKSDPEEIIQALVPKMELIPESDTWRISLNKRHTTIARNELINTIASHPKAPKGKVSLQHPKWYLVVEIIGEWCGVGVYNENPVFTFAEQ